MYFDFYEDQPDLLLIARDMQRVEGNLHLVLAILVAALLNITSVIALVILPRVLDAEGAARARAAQAVLARARQEQDSARFVFMSPRLETAPPKTLSPHAVPSDRDRAAQSPQRAERPTNMLPFSRGNTFERVDRPGTPPSERMAREQPRPSPSGERGQDGQNGDQQQPGPGGAFALPDGSTMASARQQPGSGAAAGAPGRLGDSLRNLGRYVQSETFDNQGGGGGQPGASIQFDSKGVDFGPWLRRFIAQIKRNWFIPYAAMAFKGHVVITFNVHRDGRISDLGVPGPSSVDAFNKAAYGALVSSNPTEPLPREYPSDHCFFTVTFYYNEQPPMRP
jgi:outer membrane biosynthesis protein TonB